MASSASSYILVNDLRVHYLHWGLEGSGRPAVLLHGLASNARMWELVAPRLKEAGLNPLAFDARGHGLTDKPDGDYGYATFRRDLAAILDALNLENPLLVGHSWGASVALDYAAHVTFGPRAPAGLALVDGGVLQLNDTPEATWEAVSRRLAPPRLAGTPLADFLRQVRREQGGWTPPEEVLPILLANFEIVEDEAGEGDEETKSNGSLAAPPETGAIYPRLTYERHMQILRAMWELQNYDLFPRLRCPTLVVLARPAEPYPEWEYEHLVRKERGAERALAGIPKCRLEWMADTIHDIPLQRPAELGTFLTDFAAGL